MSTDGPCTSSVSAVAVNKASDNLAPGQQGCSYLRTPPPPSQHNKTTLTEPPLNLDEQHQLKRRVKHSACALFRLSEAEERCRKFRSDASRRGRAPVLPSNQPLKAARDSDSDADDEDDVLKRARDTQASSSISPLLFFFSYATASPRPFLVCDHQ